MRYSPIGPIALLQDLHHKDLLGNYLLILAHDVLEYPQQYKELLTDVGQRAGTFVILDNSVVELGRPMTSSELKEAYKITSPDCIILPDVLEDGHQTVQASSMHAHQWVLEGMAPFMAVPQGTSVPELMMCAINLAGLPGVVYWGVPRAIANRFGTRMVMAPILGFDRSKKRDVHMLGMSQHLTDDLMCASLPGVMGIDSANPLVLGQQDILIEEESPHLPRENFWEEGEATMATVDNIHAVRGALKATAMLANKSLEAVSSPV